MPIIFDENDLGGTAGDDIIIAVPGETRDNTIYGGGGRDLIYADGDFFVRTPLVGGNPSLAYDMTANTAIWNRNEDPDILDSTTVPHTTALMEGNDQHHWFRFDLAAGQRLTVDIDYGVGGIGGDVDTQLAVFAGNGTSLLTINNSGAANIGAGGSTSAADAFLTYTATAAGTYYVRVAAHGGGGIPVGSTYVAHFSLTGQAVTNEAPGNDYIEGGDGADVIFGGGGQDSILGEDGQDLIFGGAGNDVINGGLNKDTVFGGAGDDTIVWLPGNFGDNVNGDGGTDTLSMMTHNHSDGFEINLAAQTASFRNNPHGDNGTYWIRSIENVTGSNFSDVLTGDGAANILNGHNGNDTIIGGAGDDQLNGGLGLDSMAGGFGNDRYFVHEVSDIVTEAANQGTGDTVFTSLSYALQAGAEIEVLRTANQAATTAINLAGNEISNHLIGNAGTNILDGGSGPKGDRLQGLAGNDTYIVRNAADILIEASGQGFDTVRTTVNFTLASGVEVERIELLNPSSPGAFVLTGNAVGQTIVGGFGNNVLNGLGGNDSLTGSSGADSFVFSTALNAASNLDTITDFAPGTDQIHLARSVFTKLALGALAGSAFVANDAGVATAAGHRIVYDTDSGRLSYDMDGNGSGAAIDFAQLTPFLDLTSSSFLII